MDKSGCTEQHAPHPPLRPPVPACLLCSSPTGSTTAPQTALYIPPLTMALRQGAQYIVLIECADISHLTVRHRTSLYCNPFNIVFYYDTYRVVLNCITLNCIILHCIALHCCVCIALCNHALHSFRSVLSIDSLFTSFSKKLQPVTTVSRGLVYEAKFRGTQATHCPFPGKE